MLKHGSTQNRVNIQCSICGRTGPLPPLLPNNNKTVNDLTCTGLTDIDCLHSAENSQAVNDKFEIARSDFFAKI